MNSKRIWLMIPGILFPYIVIAHLVLLFCSPDRMYEVFGPFAILYFFIPAAYLLVAFPLCVVSFICSIKNKWDSVSLAKTAMIIKLIHIPAYIAIFALSIGFVLSIWLIGAVFLMVFCDYVTLIMSSSLSIASVVNAKKENKLTFGNSVWLTVSQLIFCVDVVMAIVIYNRLRKTPAEESVLENIGE